MAIHDLFENYVVRQLSPANTALTATGNSTGVDLLGFKDDILIIVAAGAITGTTPTDAITIQTSPDNATWTTYSGLTLSAATASAGKVASGYVRMPVSHRYIRAVDTIGGTTPSFTRTILAVIRAERGSATLNSNLFV